jgi:phage terminase large subunit GpA-like protein
MEMQFQNMILSMAWGGSEMQLTTRPARYLFRDEVDELKKMVGQNAVDPMKAIEQTTSNFPNRKIVDTATPSAPEGNIWQELKTCQHIFEYWISCPYCGTEQILCWENVKFGEDHDPIVVEEMAYYECEACQGHISNLDKIRMLAKGEWRARRTSDPCGQIIKKMRAKIEETVSLDDILKNHRIKKIGFHLPKWYSPFSGGTFGVIAKEFLEANKALKEGDDFKLMRNWRIYNAAIPWEEVAISETEIELMKNKIDLSSLICPKGSIALTCGIDPGQGGFWYSVLAWRKNSGPHLVQYGWLAGDYETSQIEELLRDWTYQIEGEERTLRIWRTGIDTGGSEYASADLTMTAAAYEWIRKMRKTGLFGTKGLSREMPKRLKESRIDKMPGDKGAMIPGGLILIEINTAAIKNLIWFRLNRNVSECPRCKASNRFHLHEIESELPLICNGCGSELAKKEISGMFTFHAETEEEYIRHILAEELRLQKDGKWEWIRVRKSNHLLDCTVIAFAMADSEFRGGIRVIQQPPSSTKDSTSRPPVNPLTGKPRGGWMKG